MKSIYKYVSQLANSQRRLIDKLSKDKEYSGTQGKVIHYLFANRTETIYQKNIEEVFGLRASTATELVSSLEKMGMLKRVPSKKDARFREIILTEKAEMLKKDVFQDINALEEHLINNINQEELNTWINVTCKMLSNLGEVIDEKK